MNQRLTYPIGTIALWTGSRPAIGQIKDIVFENGYKELVYSFHDTYDNSTPYSCLSEVNLRPATPEEIRFFNENSINSNPVALIEGETMELNGKRVYPKTYKGYYIKDIDDNIFLDNVFEYLKLSEIPIVSELIVQHDRVN